MNVRLPTRATTTNHLKWEVAAVIALLIFQVTLALALPVAAPFSIDEVVYSEMTRGYASGNGFLIANGFEEVASAELMTVNMELTSDGQITGQYPYGLPILATPTYNLLGLRGVTVLNSIGLVAVVALTYLVARRLLNDRLVAIAASVVLLGGTYLWEYSLGLWPHMLALALSMGSVMSMLMAAESRPRTTIRLGLLSGFLFGLAVLSRLDAVLLLPVVAACLYQRRDAWTRAASAFTLGCIPGLAVMSWSNYVRWGSFLPFSYGRGIYDWLIPITLTGLALVVLAVVVVHVARRVSHTSPRSRLAVVTSATILILAIPVTRRFLVDFLGGIWTLVVDLRQYRPIEHSALERLPDGTLLYYSTVKKSLLQSLPYLLTVVVPIVTAWRTAQRRALIILTAPIIFLISFYAPRSWHGGLSFNLRYFLPLLPFAAVLTAWSLKIAWERAQLDCIPGRLIRISIIVGLTLSVAGRLTLTSLEQLGWFFSIPPLLIALVSAGLVTGLLIRPNRLVATSLLAVTVVGLTWAAVTAYTYDAVRSLDHRYENSEMSVAIADQIEDRSLLLASWPDDSFGVKEYKSDVVIAIPSQDEFESVNQLIATFQSSRPIYGALHEADWEALDSTFQDDWTDVATIDGYSIRRLDRQISGHGLNQPKKGLVG